MIACLIVDDHPFVRLGISALLSGQPDIIVVAEAATGEEAVTMGVQHSPDIALMDLRLPDIRGVEAIRRLKVLSPRTQCIVLTTYEGDEDIHQALSAGARGYLVKGMPKEMLLDAVRRVHGGKPFLPPPVLRAIRSRKPYQELSAREREVLNLLVAGQSNRDIATTLQISEATVKCHVGVILARLEVKDRTQAVLAALQRGLTHL